MMFTTKTADLNDAANWPWRRIHKATLDLILDARWTRMENVPNARKGTVYFHGEPDGDGLNGIMLTDAPGIPRFGAVVLTLDGVTYTFRMFDAAARVAFAVAEKLA